MADLTYSSLLEYRLADALRRPTLGGSWWAPLLCIWVHRSGKLTTCHSWPAGSTRRDLHQCHRHAILPQICNLSHVSQDRCIWFHMGKSASCRCDPWGDDGSAGSGGGGGGDALPQWAQPAAAGGRDQLAIAAAAEAMEEADGS